MLVIPESLLDGIVALAWDEAPREVCGWLAGERGKVLRVYPVPNVAEDPRTGFEMDPEAQLRAMRRIREAGLDLTGTYHSHPRTPAEPSARDLRLGYYPDCLHLIVSLAAEEPEVRAYRIPPVTSGNGSPSYAPRSTPESAAPRGAPWQERPVGISRRTRPVS